MTEYKKPTFFEWRPTGQPTIEVKEFKEGEKIVEQQYNDMTFPKHKEGNEYSFTLTLQRGWRGKNTIVIVEAITDILYNSDAEPPLFTNGAIIQNVEALGVMMFAIGQTIDSEIKKPVNAPLQKTYKPWTLEEAKDLARSLLLSRSQTLN